MLLAPAIGLLSAMFVRQKIASEIAPDSLATLAEQCAAAEGVELCRLASTTSALFQASIAVFVASVLLPTAYFFAMRALSSNRDRLARAFPGLTRGYLILVVLLLVAQAGLVAFSGADLLWAQTFFARRISLYVLVAIGVFAFGMLASAIAVLSDISRALAVESMQVTAVVAGPELGGLVKRVQRMAEQLGVLAPAHILIGIEPTVFTTAAAVRLRGNGELTEGTTLYLSAPLLRTLSEAELDALLARELSLLREGPAFSGTLVRMSSSVARVCSYVEQEGERQGTLQRYARIPASGFLAAMLATLRSALRRVRVQREGQADQAAMGAADSKALFSALTKLTALDLRWRSFRHAYEIYMLRGQTRRNLSLDFLAHVAKYVAASRATLRDSLTSARLPHAFDENATLAERAEMHSIQLGPILAETVVQLTQSPRSSRVLASLEEQVTTFENDYFHVPGRRVAVNQDEALPMELAPSLSAAG